jgi:23S rRNA (cytosine1962-C5)-methyltransferase
MMIRNRQDPLTLKVLLADSWNDYELLDSGGGQKLERFGPYIFSRPEPQAVWRPALPEKKWQKVDARFITANEENGGHFQIQTQVPSRWQMQYKNLKFWAGITQSRHLGIFPEQATHWDWITNQVKDSHSSIKVLNLFGYTGLATLAAARAGAQVTHIDASKRVIAWGRDNQSLSDLQDRPIRWIVDDALKFVQREKRRQSIYDGLVLDPPKFGRGPKGEVWEFYRLLPALLQECRQILSPQPLFIVLTAYAIQASSLTLYFAIEEMMKDVSGITAAGELATIEKSAGRIISNAIYARWSRSLESPTG